MIRDGDVFAIKNGRKVIVDFTSVDEFYKRCPRLAEPRTITNLDMLSANDLGELLGKP